MSEPSSPVLPPSTLHVRGFTLTEMAVVLAIVGLLIGGMILPLSAQQDIRNATVTHTKLADALQALQGFAASRPALPHLPCPDTDSNGTENREPDGACTAPEGDLPWADLGLGRQDVWGNALRYAVSPAFSGNTGFALMTTGTLRVCADAGCASVVATNVPALVFSRGKNGASEQSPGAAPPTFFERTPASAYDDVVAWLPAPVLIHRMISAGRLP